MYVCLGLTIRDSLINQATQYRKGVNLPLSEAERLVLPLLQAIRIPYCIVNIHPYTRR